MLAMAVLAIALTAVFGSQSQSVRLAGESKFNTTAALLAQYKMTELQLMKKERLLVRSGDFGKDFPGYRWQYSVSSMPPFPGAITSKHLVRIDLVVSWGPDEAFRYTLREYLFFPTAS
jgi:general secretion pathway protein I